MGVEGVAGFVGCSEAASYLSSHLEGLSEGGGEGGESNLVEISGAIFRIRPPPAFFSILSCWVFFIFLIYFFLLVLRLTAPSDIQTFDADFLRERRSGCRAGE